MPDSASWPPSNSHAWKHVRADLCRGIALTLIVTWVGHIFEHNWWVEQLRFVAYNRIQHSLGTESGREEALGLIRILDISRMPELQQTEKPREGNDNNLFLTPRPALRKLVDVLLDRGASAVGIDIDFSLGLNGLPRGSADVDFFDHWCKSTEDTVGNTYCTRANAPVVLGVGNNWLKHCDSWLLSPFASLAANVTVPEKDFRHTVYSVTSAEKGLNGEASKTLLSMGPKLAEVSGKATPQRDTGWLLNWALQSSDEEQVEENSLTGIVRVTPVDYGSMDFLLKNAILLPESIDDISKESVKGKVIIVGNLYSGDQFYVPLLSERRPIVPGPVIHANAFVNRVQKKAPLEPTHAGRLALDIGLVTLGLLVVAGVRVYYLRRYRLEIASERFERFIAVVSASVAILASTYLVELHRVIWDDYIWCAFLLLIHPFLAKHFWPLLGNLRRYIITTWKDLILRVDPDVASQKSDG